MGSRTLLWKLMGSAEPIEPMMRRPLHPVEVSGHDDGDFIAA